MKRCAASSATSAAVRARAGVGAGALAGFHGAADGVHAIAAVAPAYIRRARLEPARVTADERVAMRCDRLRVARASIDGAVAIVPDVASVRQAGAPGREWPVQVGAVPPEARRHRLGEEGGRGCGWSGSGGRLEGRTLTLSSERWGDSRAVAGAGGRGDGEGDGEPHNWRAVVARSTASSVFSARTQTPMSSHPSDHKATQLELYHEHERRNIAVSNAAVLL